MKQAFSVSHLGDLLRAPAVAGFVMFGVALGTFGVASQPAQAQLPPVNMGKFVHQPGDNQYSNGTQGERHGTYQVVNPSAQQTQGPSGWVPTHKSKPDISLEPIVCDEPIAKAGFPPIPDSLELPGLRGGGSFTNYGGAGGGGGGGGTAPATTLISREPLVADTKPDMVQKCMPAVMVQPDLRVEAAVLRHLIFPRLKIS